MRNPLTALPGGRVRVGGGGTKQVVDRGSFFPDYPFAELADGSWQILFGNTTLIGNREQIAEDYLGFVRQMYKGSPVVFACVMNRLTMFSEARFQFRQIRNGQPGDLFGNTDLLPLEKPWNGGTTGDLLAIAELHNSIGGNFFCARRPNGQLRVMRPDWTWLILGSMEDADVGPLDLDAEVIGYAYYEGGMAGVGASGTKEPLILEPHEVCHWKPLPDPEHPWRGMSWITPVVQEVLADRTQTQHKRKYLDAGATPNLAINLDPSKLGIKNKEDFDKWVEAFTEKREGSGGNPYKTLFLAAGADPIPIGSNLQEVDFSKIQAGGEVRIAAAAGVHPAVVGFSEGLQGSALNSGNLAEAFRQFTNQTIRPLWRNLCGSMAVIIAVPGDAQLWYDDSDIPALQEDIVNQAKSNQSKAVTIRQLVDSGFTPESVVDAVISGDFRRLKHSGLYSVQLQPPGASTPPPAATAPPTGPGAQNGSGDHTEIILPTTT